MTRASAARDWAFPRDVAGVRVLVEHGREHGLADRETLAGTGLGPADLERGEVTATQELRVVRTLQARLGPEAGTAVGRRYRAETFGVLGYALLTSHTVLDAIDLALRFVDLSFAFTTMSAAVDGDRLVGRIDGGALPADVRTFVVHRDATAVRTVLDSLVPGGVGARLDLGPAAATLELAASELARPLPDRDPEALALAERLCHDVVARRRHRAGLAQDVRVLATQRLAEGAPMAWVCAELGLSERSLRRRLEAEGTSYRELVEEVRAALATELLTTRASLPLAVVARRLGYTTPTALIHAHRRWTGRTPRQEAAGPPADLGSPPVAGPRVAAR